MFQIILMAPLVLATISFAIIAHETAHITVGWILRLPFESFKVFDLGNMAPTVRWDVTEGSTQLTVTHWAGGLGGATLAAIVYVGARYRMPDGLLRQSILLTASALLGWQVSQSVLEGAFHHAYITGANGKNLWVAGTQLVALPLGIIVVAGFVWFISKIRDGTAEFRI